MRSQLFAFDISQANASMSDTPKQSLRDRSRPPSTAHDSSHTPAQHRDRSQTLGRESEVGSSHTSNAGNTNSWRRPPGLPAVKGTIGGIGRVYIIIPCQMLEGLMRE